MPLAALRALYESSQRTYALDEPLANHPNLLTRISADEISTRLEQLSIIARINSASPFLNTLPFLTPWLIIAPMLVMVSRDSLNYPWIWVIMFAMFTFFCSIVLGPLYVNKRLTKRYLLIKSELERFTKEDCFELPRCLAWRFAAFDLDDFSADPYDITVEILILTQEDLSHVTAVGVVLLEPSHELFQQGLTVNDYYDPEIVVDPPPAYLDKPPEYTENIPLDGDYELHTFNDQGYESVDIVPLDGVGSHQYVALSAEQYEQDLSMSPDKENEQCDGETHRDTRRFSEADLSEGFTLNSEHTDDINERHHLL